MTSYPDREKGAMSPLSVTDQGAEYSLGKTMPVFISKDNKKMTTVSDSKLAAMSANTPLTHLTDSEGYLRNLIMRTHDDEPRVESRPPAPVDPVDWTQEEIVHSLELSPPPKPKKTLNPRSSVFVPSYDPTMSLTDIESLIRLRRPTDMSPSAHIAYDQELSVFLRDKGYPDYWIAQIVSMNRQRKFSRLGQLKAIEARHKGDFSEPDRASRRTNKFAKESLIPKSQVKSAGKFWRIYPRPVGPSVKPSAAQFTHNRFVNWVYCEANRLRPLITKKTQYLTGNFACEGLFKNLSPHYTQKTLQKLLDSAVVFIDDYKDYSKSRREVLLNEYVSWPERSLFVDGTTYTDAEKFAAIEPLFKRHKPLFRLSVRFLSNDSEVDGRLLQSQIDEKINTKVHKQGPFSFVSNWMPSAPSISVSHSFSVPTLNVSHSFVNPLPRLEAGTYKYEKILIQVGALLEQMRCSSSWYQIALAAIQFLAGCDYTDAVLPSLLKRLQSELNVRLQAGDEDPAGPLGPTDPSTWWSAPISTLTNELVWPIWEALVNCCVTTTISELFASVREELSVPIPYLVRSIKYSMLKEATTSFAKCLLSTISEIFGRIRQCFEKRSLAPLWGRDWNPEKWLETAEQIIIHYPSLVVAPGTTPDDELMKRLREEDKIPKHWTAPVTLTVFVDYVEKHVKQGEELIRYFKSSSAITNQIVKQRGILISRLEMWHVSLSSSRTRMQPFFMILYGETGVGKSNLLIQIPKATARMNAFDETSAGVYQWIPHANFQHASEIHWCIRKDDPGHGVAPPAAGVPNDIEDTIALVNNAPYAVESPDVVSKGKVFWNGLLYLVSTNYETMRVEALTRYPPAFWRRVNLHVEVLIKPEFCKDGGNTLDPVKANAGGTHDMYIMRVRKFVSNMLDKSDVKKVPLSPPVDMSYPDFMAMYHAEFKKHLEEQRALLKRASYSGPCCNVCGLDTNKDCGHFLPGMTVDEEIAEATPKAPPVRELTPEPVSTSLNIPLLRQTLTDFEEEEKQDVAHYQVHPAATVAAAAVAVATLSTYVKYRNVLVVGSDRLGRYPREPLMSELIVAWSEKVLTILAPCMVLLKGVEYLTAGLQAREGNVSHGLIPASWTRADQKFVPGVPPNPMLSTFSKEDLIETVRSCHVAISNKNNPDLVWHGSLVGHNAMITVNHGFVMDDVLLVTCHGKTIEVPITPMCLRPLPSNKELCIIKNGALFGSATITRKMWPVVDETIQQFDELEIWSDVLSYEASTNQVCKYLGTRVLTTSAVTKNGDCGMLYLGRFNSSWKVVGQHYQMFETSGAFGQTYRSCAAFVTTQEIERVLGTMATQIAPVKAILQGWSLKPSEVRMKPLGMYSELWAAMSSHGATPYVIGELTPPLTGQTNKTKLQDCAFRAAFREAFEEKFCGVKDYWLFPKFQGFMKDGKWTSTWTNAFKTENRVNPPDRALHCALADYLSGMEHLSREGFSELSEEQTFIGVPGSYVGAINMKTSVGPPFNKGKRGYIFLEDGKAYAAPEVWAIYDEIEECLKDRCVPSTIGVGSPKDEALKYGKFPRIFINLAFAMNAHLKKKGAGWKSFFRAHPAFFESAVGINMTSAECGKIIEGLEAICPDLTKLLAGDVAAMDKSWSGPLWDIVALVIYAVAACVGVAPMDNYLLALGLKHMTYSFKNDLFRTFWNPSGNDWTVELNGILLSICERTIWYQHNPMSDHDWERVQTWMEVFFEQPCPPADLAYTYRLRNALWTYGDDNVKAVIDPPPASVYSDWVKYVGLTMTDTAKTGNVEILTIHDPDFSFLKRCFEWDVELGAWTAKLSLLSIGRLCTIKKESTLSSIDHAAIALSEAQRELVYHGREAFEAFQEFALAQAAALGFLHNPYFEHQSFDYWRDKMKAGSFQTWSNRPALEPVEMTQIGNGLVAIGDSPSFETLTVSLQATMSSPSIVKAGNDPAHNNEQVSVNAPSLAHDTGEMYFESPAVTSETSMTQRFFQKMPENTLTDFPLRATEIATLSLSDTDGALTVLTQFDPWYLYLSNPRVVDKLANYQLIRGTLQIMFVCAIPGNAFGTYVISALPNGGSAYSPAAQFMHYANCMQVDHFVRIDCASSEDGVLQLDWLWPYDYAALPTGPVNSWEIDLTCLSPIQTAMPGGVVSGTIRVFASLMDDYELVVPHVQANPKHKLKANETMRHLAPKTHAKLTQASAAVSTVQSLAKKAEGIPIIGGYAAGVEKAAGAAKKVLNWFGFTRDTEESVPTRVTQRSVSSLAHVDGTDLSELSSLMSNNAISTDPLLVSNHSEDCMAFTSLFDRWTFVKKLTWDGSAAVGTVLGSLPVTPLFGLADTATSGDPMVRWGPAGYVGNCFRYWRGDMEYLVIIPVSKLHRGNLQVLWVPVGSTLPATTTNTTLNTIYDVTAGGEKEFKVGYARELPFLESRPLTSALSIVPVGATNGQIYFRVVTPLVSPNPDATSVDILVFSKASSNMEFAVPAKFKTYLDNPGTGLAEYDMQTRVFLQATTGDEDSHQSTAVDLVSPSGDYPMEDLLFGERIESVRALMQKPSRWTRKNKVGASNYTVQYAKQLGPMPIDPAIIDLGGNWTWQGYLRPLFTGIATSERFKFLSDTPGSFFTATPYQKPNLGLTQYAGTEPNTLAPWSCVGVTSGYEVQVPYYSPVKYVLAYDKDVNGSFDIGHDNELAVSTLTGASWAYYHSYAEDIRVTNFRQVPGVFFSSTDPTLPQGNLFY